MDVTPEAIRGIELKEGWRGYNRDQVDDFLDGVAAAVETLQQEIARLHGEIAQREAQLAKNRDDEDNLKKAILVAQRAADETLASAQAQARDMVAEADVKAREIIDAERRRTASEMQNLLQGRDALAADVAAMQQFEADYRQRLRAVIEADLVAIEGRPKVPVDQPPLHDVVIPTDQELAALAAPPGTRSGASPAVAAEQSASIPPPPSAPRETAPPQRQADSGDLDPSAQGEVIIAGERGRDDEFEDLGDDEFMASLREAVSDDAPLSPRGDPAEGAAVLFDQDHPTPHGGP